jgi:hypothetical protein
MGPLCTARCLLISKTRIDCGKGLSPFFSILLVFSLAIFRIIRKLPENDLGLYLTRTSIPAACCLSARADGLSS